MLATRLTEKPAAVDEIFDMDNTDRRITRRVDEGTRLFGTSPAPFGELLRRFLHYPRTALLARGDDVKFHDCVDRICPLFIFQINQAAPAAVLGNQPPRQ